MRTRTYLCVTDAAAAAAAAAATLHQRRGDNNNNNNNKRFQSNPILFNARRRLLYKYINIIREVEGEGEGERERGEYVEQKNWWWRCRLSVRPSVCAMPTADGKINEQRLVHRDAYTHGTAGAVATVGDVCVCATRFACDS